MNLPVHKHRKYLRAKFKAEPESLNLREAKEWLEITLNDRQGSIRRRKRVQSLAKDKVKLERESEVKTATIVHMEHQENLVKKIKELEKQREDLRDSRDRLCKYVIRLKTRSEWIKEKARYQMFRAHEHFEEPVDELYEELISYDNRQKYGAHTKMILTDHKEISKAKKARIDTQLKIEDPFYKTKETK